MSEQKNDKITKGDIISVVAILLLCISTFFGLNFKSFGDRLMPIIIASVLLIVMLVSIFLAAYAKKQYLDINMWNIVKYSCLVLYFGCLIPCYLFSSKFLDIQFNKEKIRQQIQTDIDNGNKMLKAYETASGSRVTAYITELQALSTSKEGLTKIAKRFNLDEKNIDSNIVKQFSNSFEKKLLGPEYDNIKRQMIASGQDATNTFKNWNMLEIGRDAADLGQAQLNCADELQNLYDKCTDEFENNIESFDAKSYISEKSMYNLFKDPTTFSLYGILAIIVLGGLGFLKYLTAPNPKIDAIGFGSEDKINNDWNGMIIN